jgi:2-polyprenyl-3-methyl-5-hydroxy-6-metoxy-1,4-benzoquinol methylase
MSAPAAWLQGQGLITGRVLDYGCGHGADADALGADGWDPYWRPRANLGRYNTVLCTYVLNVLEDESAREEVIAAISRCLFPGGTAYITVRRDLTGPVHTSKGTFQDLVYLDLPSVRRTSGYETYALRT